jgi:peptidyl-dipeptidase Dcp
MMRRRNHAGVACVGPEAHMQRGWQTMIVLGSVLTSAAWGDARPQGGPTDPFASPSPLAFHLPPFARIRDQDFAPAFQAGMAEQRREVDAIAHNPAPATFANTIVALEESGRRLDRVQRVFDYLKASNTDSSIEALDRDMAPKIAEHEDAIRLDPLLFARIEAVYGKRATLALDPESEQLLERTRTRFVRAGAELGEADKAKLREINRELAALTTEFRQNVLKATQDGAVLVESEAELSGLSDAQKSAARAAAQKRGLANGWLIVLQNTTGQPLLDQLDNRALRERIFRASVGRANGGPYDNTRVVARIVRLRSDRALLLGFPTHAAYVLADETAGTPAAAHAMLAQIVPAALAQAHLEAADIQHAIDAEAAAKGAAPFKLEPWDWAYYAVRARKAKFDFDDADVRPYFELDRVLHDGVFYAAHELYGLTFKERTDLQAYRDDLRIFEVYDADGTPLALFVSDYFKRDNKQGGAWMSALVRQSRLEDTRPVVANNLNIPVPSADQPVLLTFDEVRTMFHEFGHALHGMLSSVNYASLSGTNVPRDFVEYPSQFNEMWAQEPKVLTHYARHYKTGEPMPSALVQKVLASWRYGEGYATTEYVAAALVDLAWYGLSADQVPAADQVMAFEARALKAEGVDYAPIPPRYHSPYFLHVFALNYSADYYAYLWSEVLARDTGQWMHAHGGLTRANGDTLRVRILSRGRSADPAGLFRAFYGGPPEIGPLIEYRGLTLPPARP